MILLEQRSVTPIPSVMQRCSDSCSAWWLALVLTLVVWVAPARATTKGLNQIVTPDIQPAGILSLSAQLQDSRIGNSEEVQFELGLTSRLEVSLFQGFKTNEQVAGAEFNLFTDGPHLFTAGAVNWSSHGGGTQPVLEYGYYAKNDHFIAGAIYAGHRTEGILGYSHQLTEKLQFSADYQSGPGNSATLGLTYNFTPNLQMNPSLYFTNTRPTRVLGYVVVSWNIPVWK
jgi:hypothetical protein